ncbi:MAG TPA: pirin family protein [bacterium]|nr:pirin family protein [bacterium]
MMHVRKAQERGHFNYGWLDTWHTFSFADYYDPRHMSFRQLRVINEDRVAASQGFPTHPHRNMEILTYVLEGQLEHKDSMGNGSVIRPGEVQRMSAGTGVTHSEYNPSPQEPVHLLQIWILPERAGLAPEYEQSAIPPARIAGKLGLIASRDGREGSCMIHQDVSLRACRLEADQEAAYQLAPGRYAWLQVARGIVNVGGENLLAGDGAAVEAQAALRIVAETPAEVLLFDLA